MKDLLLVLGLIAGWIVLSRWVLPWLGVPTCMSGCCQGPACVSGPEPAAGAWEDTAAPLSPPQVPPAKDGQQSGQAPGAETPKQADAAR